MNSNRFLPFLDWPRLTRDSFRADLVAGVMAAVIFLSQPVLMGFSNAAAIIIGLSQLLPMLGIPSKQSAHFWWISGTSSFT